MLAEASLSADRWTLCCRSQSTLWAAQFDPVLTSAL